MINKRWYAVVDDIMGGCAVATVDAPVSQVFNEGGRVVGEFTTAREALHIVKLHNEWLDTKEAVDES